MNGLATYEIMKTGFQLLIIFCLLSSAIYCLINSFFKNYQQIQGNIVTTTNNQVLTYTVDKQYTQMIPFTTTTTNNITTSKPTFPDGTCTVYYAKTNPTDYSVNSNPLFISEIFTAVLCFIAIIMSLFLLFLSKNKDAAGVLGGVNIASSLISRN